MIPHPRDWEFPMIHMALYSALFDRAIAQGVTLRPDPENPGLFDLATSGTREGVEYRVNQFVCSCPAGVEGTVCKHRVLYLATHMDRLGRGFYTSSEAESWKRQDEELSP